MSLVSFLLAASWIADCAFRQPMISLGMVLDRSIYGISLVLKRILLTALKSASNNNITLNLVTLIIPNFFSNTIEMPLVHLYKGEPFFIAKLTILHFTLDKNKLWIWTLQ